MDKVEAQWPAIKMFLEEVRTEGKINMLASGPYLRELFDLDRREASAAIAKWMAQ